MRHSDHTATTFSGFGLKAMLADIASLGALAGFAGAILAWARIAEMLSLS